MPFNLECYWLIIIREEHLLVTLCESLYCLSKPEQHSVISV